MKLSRRRFLAALAALPAIFTLPQAAKALPVPPRPAKPAPVTKRVLLWGGPAGGRLIEMPCTVQYWKVPVPSRDTVLPFDDSLCPSPVFQTVTYQRSRYRLWDTPNTVIWTMDGEKPVGPPVDERWWHDSRTP